MSKPWSQIKKKFSEDKVMKISLRKANALQLVIQEQINEQFIGTVAVGKYDEAEPTIVAAKDKLTELVDKKFNLIDVLYSIREKVGDASAKAGIATELTQLALVERKQAFFKQLAGTKVFTPKLDVVEKALTELREQSKGEKAYYAKDAIEVSLLDKETVEQYNKNVNTARKLKQTISDKLLHLNVSTEIELDENEVSLLNKYEIL
jgi:hypothetical protein